MANGKSKIEIGIKATGGDAAAKEVSKVGDAMALTAEESLIVTQAFQEEQAQVQALTEKYEAMQRVVAARMDSPAKSVKEMVPAYEDATEAAQKTSEAVTEVKDAAEDLGSMDAAADWLERVGESTGKAADSTDEYAGNLTKLLKELAKAPGPLGETAGMLAQVVGTAGRLGPQAAIIAAAGAVGIGLAKSIIDKLDEIDAAANRTLPNLAKTSQAAQIEASALAHAQDDAAEAAKRGAKAYEDYAKSLRKVADEQAALADAELGADLAQIDIDQLNGKLSEAEALQARYDAKRTAEARKRAAELSAIEQEIANQAMENERLRAEWIAAQGPAQRAQSDLDVTGRGASTQPELAAQVAARNAAIAALAQNTSTDPAEIDVLEKTLDEAQQALLEAYDKLVAEKIKARDEAVMKSAAAGQAFAAGTANANQLASEQAGLTTGPAAQINAARDREAALRLEAAQRKIQVDAEMAAQRAREAEQSRLGGQVDKGAVALARDIEGQIKAAPNAGGNPELISALQGIAATLGDGTSQAELGELAQRLTGLLQGLSAEQAAARSKISDSLQRINNLETQLRNGRA